MATWEDGPEYAPHERPQSFAEPPVAPLEIAPPPAQVGAGAPVARPWFDQPSAPVAALATLVPLPPDVRDPHLPFEVASATLTTDSAWGSVHWNASAPVPVRFPEPVDGRPLPAPQQPFQVHAAPAPGPSGFPAPGTPDWFAPPPAYGEQPRTGRVDAKQVVAAATPGLCICLALGGLIYLLAPVMVVLAVVLSTRVTVSQRPVRLVFRGAAGLVGLIALIGLATDVAAASGWWGFVGLWSSVVCWVSLVVLLVLVWRGLARPTAPPVPPPWG